MENINLDGFSFFFGLAEGLGVVITVMVAIWTGYYRGGFAWTSDPMHQFNWHPLLMTIGLIFLYGNAIMVYRVFRNVQKRQLKLAHGAILLLAFILTVIGLQAAFDSHNLASPPIPNLYSLHSWVGLMAVVMFSCQWVAGLVTFFYPTLSSSIRAMYLPIHVFFGIITFGLAIVAAVLGLNEKAIFALPGTYKDLPGEGIIINIIGLTILIFAMLVCYVVIEPRYRRTPLPEDDTLLVRGVPQPTQDSLENPVTHHYHCSKPMRTGGDSFL